jgi:ubiquinone/menaquinone biosynthesis C-methylase UbiE
MMYWDEQADLSDLRAVIDKNDSIGHKNRWIDCLTKTALLLHARFKPSDRALDFGCGIGRISLWLGKRVGHVVAVDMSARMLEKARASATQQGMSNVSFRQYDGQTLPVEEGRDCVTCVYVLECIMDDHALATALGEMARVTRPGGQLLFIERTSEVSPHEAWSPGIIRRRPLADYRRVFQSVGLTCKVQRPVRDPGLVCDSPRVNRLVLSGAIPVWALPLVARVDLALKVRRFRDYEWIDYLFVCEKE